MYRNNNLLTTSFKKVKLAKLDTKEKTKKDVAASASKATHNDNLATQDNDFAVLKEFDLNWKYGPSMGITRLERWARAEKHGMKPSPRVKEIIEAHPGKEEYTQCLWNDYKKIM
ncbi:hypothetical protein DPMN_010729 [Dreissena polymorpha]|uniref:DNA polymerase delta subunit 4 n=1 Tax=Dreissena polymorpha TaxID=45954 RepID=A0A9D4N288_DREPO|nr:hypothetical protein DPMN_010729 [Dreissena polymorpha]